MGYMKSIRDIGGDMWRDILQRYSLVSEGKMAPWELPEYKGMEQWMMNLFNQGNKNTYQQAAQRGISGGALSELMQGMQENQNKQLLSMMSGIQKDIAGKSAEYGRMGLMDWWNTMVKTAQQKKQLDAQMRAEKMRQISQASMSGIGMMAGGISGGLGGMGGGGGGGGGGGSPVSIGGGDYGYPVGQFDTPYANFEWSQIFK